MKAGNIVKVRERDGSRDIGVVTGIDPVDDEGGPVEKPYAVDFLTPDGSAMGAYRAEDLEPADYESMRIQYRIAWYAADGIEATAAQVTGEPPEVEAWMREETDADLRAWYEGLLQEIKQHAAAPPSVADLPPLQPLLLPGTPQEVVDEVYRRLNDPRSR